MFQVYDEDDGKSNVGDLITVDDSASADAFSLAYIQVTIQATKAEAAVPTFRPRLTVFFLLCPLPALLPVLGPCYW